MLLFVSLRGGHSKCRKGKVRSYAILVSEVDAFRLMRFMTINVGCEVQYWTSVDPGSPGPCTSVKGGGPSGKQRSGSGGMEGRYFAPITNSATSRDDTNYSGRCVNGRQRAITCWQIAWTLHNQPVQSGLKPMADRRGSGTRNRSRSGVRPTLTQVRIDNNTLPCLLFLIYWGTLKMATLNVNGVSAMTRMRMLNSSTNKRSTLS